MNTKKDFKVKKKLFNKDTNVKNNYIFKNFENHSVNVWISNNEMK